ncbi:hypothetical protein [Bdellovibrio reynosensis]|uniref:Lipoprotein n=1 Tax=Bdellovibrio reynosensis TaxID=2835041 RepID=A0ABY4CG65_9BACT|nr:hypothetical protein [Bdellovibrio reynosensis]UOF02548.1 hypothetical protein MNR06_06230 [Bdellovibrio reynosensis]
MCFVFILSGILAGCSLEASIVSLEETVAPLIAAKGKATISPSNQIQAQDQSGQYRVEGVVGEITSSEQAQSQDGAYRAELNIRYQVM